MFSAVIFDVDGTLVDSVDLHAEAWSETLRHFGKELTFHEVREQIGKGADQLLREFFSEPELERLEGKIDAFRTDLFARRYLPSVQAFPKVRELLLRLQDDGIRVALASSAVKSELQTYKRVAQIEDLGLVEIAENDAAHSKPYPDIFEKVLEKLGNPLPNQVTVVGDSPYDAQAARQAHIQTLGVLCGGFPEEALRAAGCVDIYRDVADLLDRYDQWVHRTQPYRRQGVPIEASPALEPSSGR